MRAHRDALLEERGGLKPLDDKEIGLATWFGRVEGVEEVRLPPALREYDCRNNRLALLGLETDGFADAVGKAVARFGASRIGLFIGTSTSGVQETEMAYRDRTPEEGTLPEWFRYDTTHNLFSVGAFAREVLGLKGPAQVVSTACSSSAIVFAVAHRHMSAGLCDAAVVGGVDSLCLMTLFGFNSLQLVSSRPCRPADRDRDGISIGEAAGFALMEWRGAEQGPCLRGYGESCDAWHLSTPKPDGGGAAMAMRQALRRAQLEPADIGYINLHGTGTVSNDTAEDRAVFGVFDGRVPCSSTKGFTGHALGAAGIVEALFACISIERDVAFRSLNTNIVDEAIRSPVVLETTRVPVEAAMTNSFGFGGNNVSLVFGTPP